MHVSPEYSKIVDANSKIVDANCSEDMLKPGCQRNGIILSFFTLLCFSLANENVAKDFYEWVEFCNWCSFVSSIQNVCQGKYFQNYMSQRQQTICYQHDLQIKEEGINTKSSPSRFGRVTCMLSMLTDFLLSCWFLLMVYLLLRLIAGLGI